jgi:hypothetical protein
MCLDISIVGHIPTSHKVFGCITLVESLIPLQNSVTENVLMSTKENTHTYWY